MLAAQQIAYGDPDVLRASQVPDPAPVPGWTVVELRAAGLNWHDVLVRQGQYRSPLPHVPGADGAGIDRSTGDEVVIVPSLGWGADPAAPGRQWEILGDRSDGTYAELVAVPSDCLVPRPDGMSWAQAASFALTGMTTYRALFTRGRLRSGENLVVLGAGGGLATTAVTYGAAVGARVFVTSSSPDKIARAVDLGAAGGVLYTEPDWPSALRQEIGGDGADLVLDSVGTWADSVRALRPGGRVVVLGASRGDEATLPVRPFYFGQYDLLGTTMGGPEDVAGLLALLGSARVRPPVVDRIFSLDRAADAHRHLEGGTGFGKTVLEM